MAQLCTHSVCLGALCLGVLGKAIGEVAGAAAGAKTAVGADATSTSRRRSPHPSGIGQQGAGLDASALTSVKSQGPTMVFWHLEKAGGTTVLERLRRVVPRRSQPVRVVTEHSFMPVKWKGPDHFRIGLVREPCEYYVSAFFWGQRKRGWLRNALVNKYHKTTLYSNPSKFAEWASFVVGPNATRTGGCGLLSMRYWAALVNPEAAQQINIASGAEDEDESPCPLRDCGRMAPAETLETCQYETNHTRVPFDCWLRTDNLLPDLKDCLAKFVQKGGQLKPQWRDMVSGNHVLNANKHLNCTLIVPTKTEAMIRHLERSYYERFGFKGCCQPHPGNTMPA
eukprot:CAMPEP_0179036434 /NCGR_PEP_ID=MMETSP0796-20121207/13615_1 /TAXON_ID=73915 /ORGANISM="Pyrodinium bahamense, Strain pbaha01" /LENGTH=338 /DNA_ID=CAMNT_0020732719 /DNA_START=72 /DNA_END=1088 /DNA_ORIENTATION=+